MLQKSVAKKIYRYSVFWKKDKIEDGKVNSLFISKIFVNIFLAIPYIYRVKLIIYFLGGNEDCLKRTKIWQLYHLLRCSIDREAKRGFDIATLKITTIL